MSNPYTDQACAVLAQIIGCSASDLSPQDTIETVKKWDSLNHMRLVLGLEEQQGVTIDTDDVMDLFSIEGIAAFLEKSDK
jgi:acyl carrier protein